MKQDSMNRENILIVMVWRKPMAHSRRMQSLANMEAMKHSWLFMCTGFQIPLLSSMRYNAEQGDIYNLLFFH